MGAPDRLYISKNIYDTFMYQVPNPDDETEVEYVRADAFIDKNTLKIKEVLEKEIQQHINDCLDIKFPTTDIKMIAKDVEYTARKFFELGLKMRNNND